MKRFITKLIIFCLLLLPVLYYLQFIVDNGLRRSNNDFYTEWNDIYDGRVNSDILIHGSSRAWVHFSPSILDDTLKYKTYNLGIDGWNVRMQWARFKIYLEHNPKPKYIIQNLDTFSFAKQANLYNKEQFLPYLNDPLIRSACKGYEGEFTFADYYFPLYKYNSHLDLAVLGFANYFGYSIQERSKYKGYMGKAIPWDNTFDKFKEDNPDGVNTVIDSQTEKDFLEFLNYCKANDINVILVFSPEYIESQLLFRNRNKIVDHYQEIADSFKIPFLNYSNNQICFNKGNFYNSQHLNKKGSEDFSKIFAHDLLKSGLLPK